MRTERLLRLLQILRRHRQPISGRLLASELDVSIRTLYRDIAVLQAQGAQIEGEAGVGYVLRPGYFLPPLMLSPPEIEALTLGMRWVAAFADRPLAQGARDALAKIGAILPAELRGSLDAFPLRVGPRGAALETEEDLSGLRRAIRDERKIEIVYRDRRGNVSERTVWPFAIGYFATGRVLAAWCEERGDFRHFSTRGILRTHVLASPTPRRSADLFREWRSAGDRAPPASDRSEDRYSAVHPPSIE